MSESTRGAVPPQSAHPLRRLDDALFAFESGLVAMCLVVMTIIVFFDVIYRQLIAPENEIATWLAPLVTDAATRNAIAPWIGALAGYVVVATAIASAERTLGRTFLQGGLAKAGRLLIALLISIWVAAVGYLMVAASSQLVFLTLIAAVLAGYLTHQLLGRAAGWRSRIGVAVAIALVVGALVASDAFPRGYTWSKEIAMTVTLWVGFFGASLCVHAGKHIRLEALEKTHPEAAKKYIAAASHVISALFCLFLAYLGYIYVFGEGGSYFTGGNLPMSGVPYWTRLVVIPVLFAVSALRFLGAAASALMGGSYGAPAKAEGMEEAEKLAAEGEADSRRRSASETIRPAAKPARPIAFFVVLGLIVLLPLLGPGGVLASIVLAGMLLAEPLFVVLGVMTVGAFLLWMWNQYSDVAQFKSIIERIAGTADNEALLAIPFFILSGAIMARGQISARLIGFARALVGWMPGGLAISAVIACMMFAAISGSSPATVVAIGGMMAPALITNGYRPQFAHGLVTSAGSLGILIPPSIPMIVYSIVNTSAGIRVEEFFAAGVGPGILIGALLMGYSFLRGVLDKTPRDAFSVSALGVALRDGLWSLLFPVVILGGIATGLFNAVESACVSVVYAVLVEVFVHRALLLRDMPRIFGETAIMLGSFLVILVVAMSFVEFLELREVPRGAADWIRSMNLDRVQFLLVLNLVLLVVGMLMDIMSAIFVCVPLIAPMASALGIDPLHMGIIFIVNLEIGYLTPPVGLNLFVASTLFNRPVGYLVRAVLPFIGIMFVGLMVITYVPEVVIPWRLESAPVAPARPEGEQELEDDEGDEVPAAPACDPPEDLNCDGNVTIEEMTEYSEQLE